VAKHRYKPVYKKFLQLRVNVQNRKKIFKFKKQKWERFKAYSEKQLRFNKKFKLKDSFKSTVNKFASKSNSLQKRYKNNLIKDKIFSFFYGGVKKKYLKRNIKKINKRQKYKQSDFLTFKHYLFSKLKIFFLS